MAFDGDYHGAVPLLVPYSHHPDAAPGSRMFSTPLAGAYSFALGNCQIGSVLYAYHPSRYAGQRAVWLESASLQTVATVEGYVPTWADRIYATVLFTTAALEGGITEAIAACEVSTPSDGSTTFERTLQRPLRDEAGLDALEYSTYAVSAFVDLTSTTLGDDVVVTVEARLLTDEEDPSDRRPLGMRPLGVAVWWEVDT